MNIIEEIRAFREIVLGKQDKLVPGDHIILGDDDVISVDFGPVDALLDRLEEVEDDVNTLNFDVTELDIRLDAAEENIDDAQDHLDSIDDSIDVLSSDLEALGQKVDNIHGFEIIALSEGQYDPITMKPTIQNPKTNTLYLVPNYDPTQRNLWIEWLWLGGRWEQFGTAVIDLSEYVMKTDLPTTTTTGVVKVNRLNGIQLLTNGQLAITPASIGDISSGQSESLPITPYQQHNAVFYGLARAARTPALYYSAPDKTNIRLMLDAGSHAQVEELAEQVEGYGVSVAQLLNTDKTTPAGMVWESKEYGAGWSEAAQGKVVDVLKDGESLMDEHGIVELPDVDVPTKTSDLVNDSGFITESSLPTKVSDLENDSGFLVSADLANYALISDLPTKVSDLQNDSGFLTEVPIASSSTVGGIKTNDPNFWTGINENGVFYASKKTYSQYTTSGYDSAFISKGTLENVLNGRGYPVDIRIDGASIIDENKVANIPIAGLQTYGLIKTNTITGITVEDGYVVLKETNTINGITVRRKRKAATDYAAITTASFDQAVKHALTDTGTGSGDDLAVPLIYTEAEQAAARARLGITHGGLVDDVKINGTSIVDENKIANIPIGVDSGDYGMFKVKSARGLIIGSDGYLAVHPASTALIKAGTDRYRPITSDRTEDATFYGLAKAAGDTTQSASSNPVGTYTDDAKTAIKSMLGITAGGLVDDVKIDGTSIVDENKVANIPVVTDLGRSPGLINMGGTHPSPCIAYHPVYKGWYVPMAGPTNLSQRHPGFVVSPSNLDSAVKAALTDGVGPDYTTAEQSAARTRFGAASETDLEDLSRRVDALHGFEIVFLTTGEYDPETGIPTILGPQEGTLYLVPSGQEAPDVWTEWLWTGEAWEKFGSSSIDLSNYVQKTDYANASTGGVIKTEPFYGSAMVSSGILRSVVKSYDVYADETHTAETAFISKGTLENVLTERIPDVPSISYDETEEMLVWQTTANDGNEVSY